MQKEKKLYLILFLLMVFALIGEQPKLGEDLRRTATVLMDLLEIDEIVFQWGPIVENVGRNIRHLAG
jgi:hypothetical protein